MLGLEDEDEIQERQAAELEFVESAYSKDEAWIIYGRKKGVGGTNDLNKVYRRLELNIADDGCHHHHTPPKITVDLEITMPAQYPIYESSPLQIDASLSSSSSSAGSTAKRAMDAIPDLLKACRFVALENAGHLGSLHGTIEGRRMGLQ